MLALLLGAGVATSSTTWAMESPKKGSLSVVLENDLFYDVDQHYTNGVGFIWVPSRDKPTPEWVRKVASVVPWIPREGELLHGYAFGQSMFTPADTDATNPPQWDRPYAGWLYGLVGMGVATGQRLDLLSLSVGIVGPASLAEQTQKAVHELSRNKTEGSRFHAAASKGLIWNPRAAARRLRAAMLRSLCCAS